MTMVLRALLLVLLVANHATASQVEAVQQYQWTGAHGQGWYRELACLYVVHAEYYVQDARSEARVRREGCWPLSEARLVRRCAAARSGPADTWAMFAALVCADLPPPIDGTTDRMDQWPIRIRRYDPEQPIGPQLPKR